jgi:hypothetical protein
MKAADFFIGARQLFGFVLPGAVWNVAWMLFHRIDPGEWLFRDPALVRVAIFCAVSFVVGFTIQTAVFQVVMRYQAREKASAVSRPLRAGRSSSRAAKRVELDQYREKLLNAVAETMRGTAVEVLIGSSIPQHCKRYVIENSEHLRVRVLELEAEINLFAGLAFPLPVVACALMIDQPPISLEPVLLLLGALLSAGMFLTRLFEIREGEELMWCEMYLLLRSSKSTKV